MSAVIVRFDFATGHTKSSGKPTLPTRAADNVADAADAADAETAERREHPLPPGRSADFGA
jgi:hypothetical protein